MRRSGQKIRTSVFAGIGLLLAVSGCAECNWPRIDPTGEHLFVYNSPPPPATTCPPGTVRQPAPAVVAAPPVAVAPAPAVAAPTLDDDVAVTLSSPYRAVPVGAEVFLVAGVRGGDNYLRTNRRLDWQLAPGSAGQFADIGRNGVEDIFVGDFSRPRVLSNTTAIGDTGRAAERVGPGGSTYVASGESWISLRSATEGVSRVTVVAPQVVVPAERAKTATIYWYDARYRIAEPVVTPAGSKATLCTSVWQFTSRRPLAGWIVRYELTGGPQAVFVPSGTTAVDVPTDAAGRATVDLVQSAPSPGTSQVRVQLFHPAVPCMPQFLVRAAGTAVEWTTARGGVAAPQPAAPVLPGPASSPTVTAPPATVRPPITSRPPETRPAAPPVPMLEVQVTQRTLAIAGSNVTFTIEVANSGNTVARGVVVFDSYGDGLQHAKPSPLNVALGDLAAGNKRQFSVTFRATRAGQLCHRVDVRSKDGGRAEQISCVVAAPAAQPSRPVSPPPGPSFPPNGRTGTPEPGNPAVVAPPGTTGPLAGGSGSAPPAAAGKLRVRVDNRNLVTAGKNQQFLVQVTNDGDAAVSGIVVSAQLPSGSTLVDNETFGPGATIRPELQGGVVRFSPMLSALDPKNTVSYRISVTTSGPGPISLEADATARGVPEPARGSKTVEVLPE